MLITQLSLFLLLFRVDGSVTISKEDDPFRVWKTSPAHTGFRSLAIISILQMYLSVDSESRLSRRSHLFYVANPPFYLSCFLAYEAAASEVISFYAARLQDAVGEGFQVATLAFYAEYWLHSSGELILFLLRDQSNSDGLSFPSCLVEIQQAARVLFGSVLAQTPDEEILAIVEQRQHERECFLLSSKPFPQEPELKKRCLFFQSLPPNPTGSGTAKPPLELSSSSDRLRSKTTVSSLHREPLSISLSHGFI